MAGRDIGTVVLPDAHIKFYIDASLEERARRRVIQKQLEGQSVDLAEITAALARRDQIDSERAVSPLKTADDAIRILTDGKTVEETVAEIAEYLYRWAENSTNSAHENPQTT
jgi:cytidylate kinase